LHDLGKLVLAANYYEPYREVYELSRHGELTFHEAEIKVLGGGHPCASRRLSFGPVGIA